MALTLRRVELSNIRYHKSVAFEPAQSGVTSISGPNGAGKSTLVDSVAWVLYGTKPHGVSKVVSIVREGAVLGTDRIFASLELEVDGRLIKVERRFVTKTGGVECEVHEGTVGDDGETVEWKNVAGPSVSHAEPYLRKLIHMDEKGFLAAILIQQKQVDQLISATPRERGAVIEKLTGISSITAAVTEARQEYNGLKKMAAYSTVDEEGLARLRTELATLEADLERHTSELDRLTTSERELKSKGRELSEKVKSETAKAEAAASAKQRLAALEATIEAKNNELSRLMVEKNEKKKRLSSISTGAKLSDVEEKLSNLHGDLRSREEVIYGLKSKTLNAEDLLSTHRALIERSSIKTLEAAEAKEQESGTKKTEAEKRLVQLRRSSAGLEAQRSSLLSAARVIQEGEGKCPTCLQEVSEVETAVKTLESEAQRLAEEVTAANAQEERFQNGIGVLEANLRKCGELILALTEVPDLEAQLAASASKLEDLLGEKRALEGEIKAVERVHSELKAQESLKEEYSNLLAVAQSVSGEIEKLKGEEQELKAKDFGVLSPKALEKLRSRFEESRTEFIDLTAKLSDERSEVRVLKERVTHTEEKLAHQEEQVVKHRELLKSVEVASNSTQLLEEFRSNRIESSVPLIESYASDLLSRFTEGRFTRLKLDGKFNASVVLDNGNERGIGLLSGGELSAASIALRLAVAMLLNGGSAQSLIILDEVLVSQDFTRAELILSTIKQVCKGQVVLIAHNESIHDIADKLVELT